MCDTLGAVYYLGSDSDYAYYIIHYNIGSDKYKVKGAEVFGNEEFTYGVDKVLIWPKGIDDAQFKFHDSLELNEEEQRWHKYMNKGAGESN